MAGDSVVVQILEFSRTVSRRLSSRNASFGHEPQHGIKLGVSVKHRNCKSTNLIDNQVDMCVE